MGEQLQIRDDAEESFTGGGDQELPTQMGAPTPTILPGVDLFRLPANIDRLWEAKDYEKKDATGAVLTDAEGKPVVEQHLLLKFDQENPMVVQGGDFDGLPATATITTIPRKRGKKDDANAPMVHDMTYFVRECLNDKTTVTMRKEWIAIVNRYPGAVIRLEHGLSAQCDPERVRYISDGAGGVVQDPDGNHGCGDPAGKYASKGGRQQGQPESRVYTQGFKIVVFVDQGTNVSYNTREEALNAVAERGGLATDVKQAQAWTDHVVCKGCGAMLRGFFRIEKFLKPLASPTQVG